jgi:anti-anti-sigma factor
VLTVSWSEDLGLRVDVRPDANESVTVVRLAGEFDFESVEVARRAVQRAGSDARQVIVDLSRVTFFDAAGVRFLLAAREQVRAAGGDLVLRHPSWRVRRVLDLVGALSLLCPDGPGGFAPPAAPSPQLVSACERALARLATAGCADMGNAQVVVPASRSLRIVAQDGFKSPFLDFFEIVHDEESACGTALAEARPAWVSDVAWSPIFAGTPAMDIMLGAGSRSVASVPVLNGDGTPMAMISAHRREPGPWTDLQRRYLKALAATTGRLLSV